MSVRIVDGGEKDTPQVISLFPPTAPASPKFSIRIESQPEWSRIYASRDPEKEAWFDWQPETGQNLTPSSVSAEVTTLLWFKVVQVGYEESEPFLVRGSDYGENGSCYHDFKLEPNADSLRAMGLVEW